MKSSIGFILAMVAATAVGTATAADGTWDRFLALRVRQMQEKARAHNVELPEGYTSVLAAVKSNDWPATSNAFNRVFSGTQEGNPRASILWQDLLEIYGAFEQFAQWRPSLIRMYGEDILAGVASNSIVFGGTDPGRFVVTAFQEATRKPFRVVTQNALADNTYMEYLRDKAGAAIWLPSQEDSSRAFQQYVQDVQSGRMPANAEIKIEDGRISVMGVGGVMTINGIMARMIFDRNRTNHAFYVEESYVIPWMYPYLRPAGLVMRLNPEPVELTAEMAAEDRRFWDAYEKRLLAHPDFGRDEFARKTYSKLRSAIAGLFAYRGRTDDAEHAFRQAQALCPASPEAAFRLADLYANGGRWDEAMAVMEEFRKVDPKNDMADRFLANLQDRRSADKAKPSHPSDHPQ